MRALKARYRTTWQYKTAFERIKTTHKAIEYDVPPASLPARAGRASFPDIGDVTTKDIAFIEADRNHASKNQRPISADGYHPSHTIKRIRKDGIVTEQGKATIHISTQNTYGHMVLPSDAGKLTNNQPRPLPGSMVFLRYGNVSFFRDQNSIFDPNAASHKAIWCCPASSESVVGHDEHVRLKIKIQNAMGIEKGFDGWKWRNPVTGIAFVSWEEDVPSAMWGGKFDTVHQIPNPLRALEIDSHIV